ncbi:hypothetical protein KNE206_07820 [Kitasatospora sp. NE20-6]
MVFILLAAFRRVSVPSSLHSAGPPPFIPARRQNRVRQNRARRNPPPWNRRRRAGLSRGS